MPERVAQASGPESAFSAGIRSNFLTRIDSLFACFGTRERVSLALRMSAAETVDLSSMIRYEVFPSHSSKFLSIRSCSVHGLFQLGARKRPFEISASILSCLRPFSFTIQMTVHSSRPWPSPSKCLESLLIIRDNPSQQRRLMNLYIN